MHARYHLPMGAPHRPHKATFADLEALGDDARAEVINGEIVEKAAPTFEHAHAQFKLAGFVGRRFGRHPGGKWPGGWWFGSEVDVEYEANQIFCHDSAGWRRDRIEHRPTGRPVRVRPDWVCELLSPKHEKRDLIDKMKVLHACGVRHYWIANPENKTLVVHRWTEKGYLIILTAATGETVRAEPFDAVELRVGVLFGDEDDDE